MKQGRCSWCNYWGMTEPFREKAHECHGPEWFGMSLAASHVVFGTLYHQLDGGLQWVDSMDAVLPVRETGLWICSRAFRHDFEISIGDSGLFYHKYLRGVCGGDFRIGIEFSREWLMRKAGNMFPDGGYRKRMVDVNPMGYGSLFSCRCARLVMGPRIGEISLRGDIVMSRTTAMCRAHEDRADLYFSRHDGLRHVLPVMIYCSTEDESLRSLLESMSRDKAKTPRGRYVPSISSAGNDLSLIRLDEEASLQEACEKFVSWLSMESLCKGA